MESALSRKPSNLIFFKYIFYNWWKKEQLGNVFAQKQYLKMNIFAF